ARTDAASPSAMSLPRASTTMRSAKANTTSIECSVNSTEMPRSTTRRLTRLISSVRSRGAMPAVGSSISSKRGSLPPAPPDPGPLDVAVRGLRARPLGGPAQPDLGGEIGRGGAMTLRRRAPAAEGFARVRDQRHLHVLGNGHRAEGGGDLEGAPHPEPPHLA